MMSTDKTQPLVTVYMPTYNRAELLQRAVDSVLQQDYRNIELIVVDDNSTDGTHEFLAKMADGDPRFKYFINEKNSGACVSRNKAISAANGEFITGLDDDDYFLPNHVSSLLSAWKSKASDVIAVYPNSYVKKRTHKVKVLRPKNCKHLNLIHGNWIGNQIFTKTSYLKSIKGFDVKFRAWQDLDCWYSLLKQYNSKAGCTNVYSYVIDISHPHERITSGKVNAVIDSYDIFTEKHSLSGNEKEVLKLQLCPYTGHYPKIMSIFYSLKLLPTYHNFRSCSLMLLKPLKKYF